MTKLDSDIWTKLLEGLGDAIPAPVVSSVLGYAELSVNETKAYLAFPQAYMLNLLSHQVLTTLRERLSTAYDKPLEVLLEVDTSLKKPLDDETPGLFDTPPPRSTRHRGESTRRAFVDLDPVDPDNIWSRMLDLYEERYGVGYIPVGERTIVETIIKSRDDKGCDILPTTLYFAWGYYLDDRDGVREEWRGIRNFINIQKRNYYIRRAINEGPPAWMVKTLAAYRCSNHECHGEVIPVILKGVDDLPDELPDVKCLMTIDDAPCKGRFLSLTVWTSKVAPLKTQPPTDVRPPPPPPVLTPTAEEAAEDPATDDDIDLDTLWDEDVL